MFPCSVAANCNKQKYQAKRAGEQSIELYLTLYIGLHGPLIKEAVVMDVKDLSFDVVISSMGLVQRIYTNVSTPRVQCHYGHSLEKQDHLGRTNHLLSFVMTQTA
jgi:exoribonuclease R